MVRALVRLPLGVPISNEPKFPAGVTNFNATDMGGQVNIKYTDPEDSFWTHTRVYYIKGQNMAFNDIEKEGTLLFESTTRNQYKDVTYKTVSLEFLLGTYYTVFFVTYSKDGYDKDNIQKYTFFRGGEVA